MIAFEDDTLVVGSRTYSTEAGSVFVYERSPDNVWTETVRLEPSSISFHNHFGERLALSNDVLLVGATAVDGGGKAYVYRKNAVSWALEQELAPALLESGDRFGDAVALEGDRALVVATGDNLDGSRSVGAAYIFDYDGGVWSETQKLTGQTENVFNIFFDYNAPAAGAALMGDIALWGQPCFLGAGTVITHTLGSSGWTRNEDIRVGDAIPIGYFGQAIASQGDFAYIGEPGNSTDALRAGAVHIYAYAQGTWSRQGTLYASDPEETAGFGSNLALSGDTLFVYSDSNIVYVFERMNGFFMEVDRLTSGDDLGRRSLALDGDTALVGVPRDSVGGSIAGAVLVYERDNGAWTLTQELRIPAGMTSKRFGASVALEGDVAVVTSSIETEPGIFEHGIFLYERGPGEPWGEPTQLNSSTNRSPSLPMSVSISNGRVAVGGQGEVVTVFERGPGAWVEAAQIDAPDVSTVELRGDQLLLGQAPLLTSVGMATLYKLEQGSWQVQRIIEIDGAEEWDQWGRTVHLGERFGFMYGPLSHRIENEPGRVFAFPR